VLEHSGLPNQLFDDGGRSLCKQQRQYVGIDLHRRRSVIVRADEHGRHLSTVRIENDAVALAAEVAKAGEHPEVVLEATYGWYWVVDVLEELGANVHLAHLGAELGAPAAQGRRDRRHRRYGVSGCERLNAPDRRATHAGSQQAD
jgi:hypothetical protein